jgi:hypothetical protein
MSWFSIFHLWTFSKLFWFQQINILKDSDRSKIDITFGKNTLMKWNNISENFTKILNCWVRQSINIINEIMNQFLMDRINWIWILLKICLPRTLILCFYIRYMPLFDPFCLLKWGILNSAPLWTKWRISERQTLLASTRIRWL